MTLRGAAPTSRSSKLYRSALWIMCSMQNGNTPELRVLPYAILQDGDLLPFVSDTEPRPHPALAFCCICYVD